jgi:translation initiation factor 2 beta subunit (eIF-2beta)/eIF-5
MKEVQKVLEELKGVKPEQLTGEAKRLFEAIMKIADERDKFEYKYNRAIEDLIKLEKERQADKEKIKELESDKEIKDKMIDLMSEHLTTPVHDKKWVIEYFENLAKESGEIDENNRIIE